MSTGTIFYFAVGVFTLMVIGIILTGLEFRKMTGDLAARKQRDSDRR
jgi:ABC-type long-subunit fatty acid transport system fused permease/ATPase subunit